MVTTRLENQVDAAPGLSRGDGNEVTGITQAKVLEGEAAAQKPAASRKMSLAGVNFLVDAGLLAALLFVIATAGIVYLVFR